MGILGSIFGKKEIAPEQRMKLESARKAVMEKTGEIFSPFSGFGQDGYSNHDQTAAIFLDAKRVLGAAQYEKNPALLSKQMSGEEYMGRDGFWYNKKWFDVQHGTIHIPKRAGLAVIEVGDCFLVLSPKIG